MKKNLKILRIFSLMLILFSCDWPETVVTNYVHPDGSVTRKIVMKNDKRIIDPADYRVPVDSTWKFSESFEMRKKDTVWIITAEKLFNSVREINEAYLADTSANRNLKRQAVFSKKFRWFNNYYYFSEEINRIFETELKPDEFFNEEDKKWFFMPGSISDSLLKSPDSLKYNQLKASADSAGEVYLIHALVDEWILNYLKLVPDSSLIYAKRDLLIESGLKDEVEDSIFILALGTDYYTLNKTAIDSAISYIDGVFSLASTSRSYAIESVMPGQLVATNGFIKMDGSVLWSIDSKYFISEDYIMWAESKMVNQWAWIMSGIIILILLSAMVWLFLRSKSTAII